MTKQLEMNDVAKEIVEVLKYFDSKFVSKIPIKFLDTLNELAKQSNLVINIDKDKKLKDQNISEETKDLLSLIYYDYIATDEEKNEIIKIWSENQLLHQEKRDKKYSQENLFKNKSANEYKQEITNLPSIIQKETVIQKIIKFLKRIF